MKKLLALLALAASTMLTGCGVGTIAEGNAAIVYGATGKFAGTEAPGLYINPFQDTVEYVMKEITMSFDNQRPKAKDDLSLQDLDVDVVYRVNGTENLAKLVLKRAGSSSDAGDGTYYPAWSYIAKVAESQIADAVSQFDSMTIHKSRDELGAVIKKQLQAALDTEDAGAITVARVQVRRALPDATIEENIRKVINKQKEKEAADLEEEIAKALARANSQKTAGLSNAVLQEKYLDAMTACAKNQHCTMIIDGTSSQKMLNVGR